MRHRSEHLARDIDLAYELAKRLLDLRGEITKREVFSLPLVGDDETATAIIARLLADPSNEPFQRSIPGKSMIRWSEGVRKALGACSG